MDDEVESCQCECCLPRDTESDDNCWDERDEWPDIWDELHDPTDDRECECLFSIESEYPLHEYEAEVCRGEYTYREYQSCLDPSSCDMLDRSIVASEVPLDARRGYIHEELSDPLALEYHEECRDRDESPVRDNSTHSRDNWDAAARERGYLRCDDWLDVTSILLDDVECMFDIGFTEYEQDNSLYIWVKMKPCNPFSHVYWLSTIDPVDHESRCLCDIIDHDRYQCADDDTSEEKYDDIDRDECQPWWYLVLLAEVDEWIHDDREESCYQDEHDDRWEHPEDIESSRDREDDEDLLHPEGEFLSHTRILGCSYHIQFSQKSKPRYLHPMRML